MSDQTPTEKPTGLALLRVAFPPNQISKLPKGGVLLDYVGHAALTDRLLDADLTWNWAPAALDPDGLPKFDANGGMWIQLTVCGVTRLGYGDAAGKKGPNAVKEAIGDALRNAAMRFGAALDLWHKGELHADDTPEAPTVPAMPAGYQEWLTNLEAAADEGITALESAYKAKAPEGCKAYLVAHGGGTEPLKARARKAGGE